MTTTRIVFSRHHARALLVAVAVATAPAAFAQGTPEQREACAPDAIRLCQDTIPDVGRTTACMASHRGELSPRCAAAFAAALDKTTPAEPRSRVARLPRHHLDEGAQSPAAPPRRAYAERVPDAPPAPPYRRHRHRDNDADNARAVLAQVCGARYIGADTCAFTNRMIDLAE